MENNVMQMYVEVQNALYVSLTFCDLCSSNHGVAGVKRALAF